MNKTDILESFKRRKLHLEILRGIGNIFLFKQKNERVTVVKIKENNQVYFYYTDCDSRYEGNGELHRHQYYVHIAQFIRRIK